MKTKIIAAGALSVFLAGSAAAATVIYTDPLNDAWNSTTHVVVGAGAVAADTWDATVRAVTPATTVHTTAVRARTPAATTPRYTAARVRR